MILWKLICRIQLNTGVLLSQSRKQQRIINLIEDNVGDDRGYPTAPNLEVHDREFVRPSPAKKTVDVSKSNRADPTVLT
jgi:hypothetical protein